MRKKLKKDKDYSFRDILPIIINVIILILLVAALIIVITLKVSSFVKEDTEDETTTELNEKNVLTENKVSIADDSCATDLAKEVSKMEVTFTMDQVYIETVTPVDTDPETAEDEAVFQTRPVIYVSNFDKTKYVLEITDKDGTRYNYSTDEDNGYAFFYGLNASEIIEYTILIKGKDCDDTIRSFTFKAPIYNHYSELDICKEYPEYEWCASDTSYEALPTWSEFYDGIDSYIQNLVDGKITTRTTSKLEDKDGYVANSFNEYNVGITTSKIDSTNEDTKDKVDITLIIIIVLSVFLALVIVYIICLIRKKRGMKNE